MTPLAKTLQLALLSAAVACGAGCRGQAAPAPASDAERGSSEEGRDAIVLDPKMMASIKVDTMLERDAKSVLTVAGKVQFDEDRVGRVLAPLAGQVVDLHVKVGDHVRKSQLLCALSSRDAAAAAGDRIESLKDVELAEKNAAMTQDLFDHEAASKMALQQAQNDLAKARARLARTEETLRVLGIAPNDDLARFNGRVPILSPLAGVVIERHVTEGQFAPADGTPLLMIANLDSVWVIGDIFERDLRLVNRDQSATVTTAAYPDERFQAKVNYVSDAIDPASRTAKVRVSVTNPGGRLKPEMYVGIALSVSEPQRANSVPAEAVFTEDGRSFVYVELSAGKFARRPVSVEPGSGSTRRILTGLQRGDRVVVGGALLLRQEEQQRAS